MSNTADFTQGSILKKLCRFMLPVLGALILQAAYGAVDLLVVGRFGSTSGLSAVSTGSQVLNLVTFVVTQLAMGVTVLIARYIGEKREKEIGAVLGGAAVVFTILAGCLFVLLVLFARPISVLMQAPQEALALTASYVRICGCGILFIVAYNVLSAVFRGLGDSRSPLLFVLVACLVNVAGDLVLVAGLHLDAAGAALATVLAQAVSVVVSLLVIRRERDGIALTRGDFRPQRAVMGRILRIGVPVALQDGLIQIAFLFITVIANRRGLTDAAAVGIVEKIISFLFLVPSSMLSTVSALGAQCIGAGKPRRALQTLWYAIAIAFGFGVLITIVIQFVAEPVVSLFTDSAAVAAAGGQYLRGYILDCCFAGLHFCFSGYFCAIGRSELSFLHNITAVVLVRVPGAYLMSKWFPTTLLPMGLATAAGSLLSVIICVIAFLVLRRRGRLVPEEA